MSILFISSTFSQIEFVGDYEDDMGGAGWNADGTGPEPYGNGHGDIFYYVASRDYLDGGESCGAQMTNVLNGFPAFEQSLVDNGYSTDQVTLKFSLADLGDDIEGVDYFSVAGLHYCNFYPAILTMELDGEALVEATGNYTIYIVGTNVREFESGFLKVNDISGSSSLSVQNVAAAFIDDMANKELQLLMQLSENVEILTGSGRSGAYTNVSCTIEKGLPEIPMQGLVSENMGTAGWNADGSGPEPYGNGHDNMVYYSASVDYDGINPNPDACLANFINGSVGFMNTLLQLQYRGFEIGDLKLKMGLCSLGPDIEGEDWGFENGMEWLNEYNLLFTFEIDGEPILEMLQDTNKMTYINPGTVTWATESSVGKVYDISANASADAQFVAQSFLKDLGSHYLKTEVSDITLAGSMPSGNGRSGVFYDLVAGSFVGVHEKATFLPEGSVSGNWSVENSPYYIEGHLTVENGETLEIEPGVRIGIRGPYQLNVEGAVDAKGSADHPIMFTASNPNIYWDGIEFDDTPIGNDSSLFDNCIFRYAHALGSIPANSGGAILTINFNKISITNSLFEFNKADISSPPYTPSGGAIGIINSSPLIQKCIFRNNKAEDAAAIVAYDNASPVISNCLFHNNQAASDAGVIEFNTNSNGIIINNTFADNHAANGGAIQVKSNSSPMFINNIFWGNEASTSGNQVQIEDASSQPGFYYCDIEGGQADFGGVAFTGNYLFNIEEDPLFDSNGDYPYALQVGTPCYNAGTPDTSSWFYSEYLPETCLMGIERIYDGRIEMGAYELLFTGIHNPDNYDNSDLKIYPNPTSGQFTIEFTANETAVVLVEIVNGIGQQVWKSEELVPTNGTFTLDKDLTELPEGIYYCRIQTENKTITKKIIKVK
jgi:hypothetical protein